MKLESRIWKLLCSSKYKEYYLQTQIEVFQSLDSRLNSIIALISASSIVAWFFLEDYFYLWALVLITAQVTNILKPAFPFRRFLSECKRKLKNIKNLNIEIDLLWLEVKTTQLPINASEDRCIHLKEQVDTIAVFEEKTPLKFKKTTNDKVNKKMKPFLKD